MQTYCIWCSIIPCSILPNKEPNRIKPRVNNKTIPNPHSWFWVTYYLSTYEIIYWVYVKNKNKPQLECIGSNVVNKRSIGLNSSFQESFDLKFFHHDYKVCVVQTNNNSLTFQLIWRRKKTISTLNIEYSYKPYLMQFTLEKIE